MGNLEKNVFHTRTNKFATLGPLEIISDMQALGEHLKSLDEKWTFDVGNGMSNSSPTGCLRIALKYQNCCFVIGFGYSSSQGWIGKRASTLVSMSYSGMISAQYASGTYPSEPYCVIGLSASVISNNPYSPSSPKNHPEICHFKEPCPTSGPTPRFQYLNWGIGLTDYGAVLTLPILSNDTTTLSPASIDCYIFSMQNVLDKNKKTWAVLVNMGEPPVDETNSSFYGTSALPTMCLLSGEHTEVEHLPIEYLTSMQHYGTMPVLTNVCSKTTPYYAPHLYIKETAHENCFGHIKIDDTYFLAGAGFCLEAKA